MKKQINIALMLAICSFSFAQKKEVKAAEKAIKSSNFSEAKAALGQAKALMSSMDAKTKDKFYLLEGQALYANGAGTLDDFDKSIESLDKIENGYASEVSTIKQSMVNSMITKGNSYIEQKDFSTASKFYEKSYRLSSKDTLYLYAAAAYSVNVQEYDRALKLYEELKDLNYDGSSVEYYAVNKATQQEEFFPNKQTRDLSVKTKTHIKPFEKTNKSRRPEIVKNIALIYVSSGENEKALAAMKDARAESPNDVNLILSEANVHYKMGNNEKFSELLKEATTMDPTNPELQYNLGVIAAESGKVDQAKEYYEKAIELDANYTNAYINIAALILGEEKEINKEMDGLGFSAADEKRFSELKVKKQGIYKSAEPYLLKVLEMTPDNVDAARTLMSIYTILEENDKYKELKAKVEALEAGN